MRRIVGSNGFALIEVVVASALLMVVWLAGARLFAASAAANAGAKGITMATVLATEKMEQLRAVSLDDPALEPSPTGALSSDFEGYHDVPDPRYVRRWSIEPLPSYPDSGVVIAVVVRRLAGLGDAHLTTIRTRRAE